MKIILTYASVFSRDLIIEQSRHHQSGMEVLASSRVAETIDMINRGIVLDLIILDEGLADMKGLNGLMRIQKTSQQKIPTAIMGIPTSQSEMQVVLNAGAVGYIPKNIGIKAFYSAITLMAEGEAFIPAIPAEHSGHKNEYKFLTNKQFTNRELDMLKGLLAGESNKEIARQHNLSEVTVKHHLKSLRGKLGARNRTHAVCRAIELGIVPE